jgi:predicted deacylase
MRSLGAITTDFDFDTPGKRSGFIDLTYSDNDNAFSVIRLPVGVIKNGHGPTILLTAGSHGDEYEGQVILHRLMQTVATNDIQGRIILLPALNMPRSKVKIPGFSFGSREHEPKLWFGRRRRPYIIHSKVYQSTSDSNG